MQGPGRRLASGLTGLWVQAPHCSPVPGRLLAAVPDLSWWVLVALRPWPWGQPSQRLHWGRKPNRLTELLGPGQEQNPNSLPPSYGTTGARPSFPEALRQRWQLLLSAWSSGH